MTDKEILRQIFTETKYTAYKGATPDVRLSDQFSDDSLDCILDALIARGVTVEPCKEGDTIYRIYKACEPNDGLRPEFAPDKVFVYKCPYLEEAQYCGDCDECRAVKENPKLDSDDAYYCTINVTVFHPLCKERLVIRKDKFSVGQKHNVYKTPMFNENTLVEDMVFLTYEDALEVVNELKAKEI